MIGRQRRSRSAPNTRRWSSTRSSTPKCRSATRRLRRWMPPCPSPCTGENLFLGRPASWLESAFCYTAGAEAHGTRFYRISTLGRMLPSVSLPCSRVMPPAIAAIFRKSRSSLPRNAGERAVVSTAPYRSRFCAAHRTTSGSEWPIPQSLGRLVLEPQGQLARWSVVQQLQVLGLVLAVEEEVEQAGERLGDFLLGEHLLLEDR